MCGIVAYIGRRQASPILLEGLKRLEYRGYDSAGVAVMEKGKLNVAKAVGRVRNVEDLIEKQGNFTNLVSVRIEGEASEPATDDDGVPF